MHSEHESGPTTPPEPEWTRGDLPPSPELTPTPAMLAEQEARWSGRAARTQALGDVLRAERPALMRASETLSASGADATALTTPLPMSSVPALSSACVAPTLSRSEAAAMMEAATVDDALDALAAVMGALGHRMDAGRIQTVALVVADQGWTKAELRAATRALASSPALRDHIRYGGTITPADFEAARTSEERTVGEGEERRQIITIRGYALTVRRGRLYRHAEAFALWQQMGEPGRFSDSLQQRYADSAFEAVRVEGDEAIRFRFKA